MNNLPAHLKPFNIDFPNGNRARAVRVKSDGDPAAAMKLLGLKPPTPVIFISGGASFMSDEDRKLIRRMLDTIARFAQEHKAVIIDGGTEAGVMQMIGDVRQKGKLTFPLIGVSPLGKVSYPGFQNPKGDALLEDSHTHFILVDGDNWGTESSTIMHLAYTMCGSGKLPSVGVLINGGEVALHEVYLASTTKHKLAIIVLEGSGRAADVVSTAVRTGKTSQRILKAILKGGDIQLVATKDGPQVLRAKLAEKFKR